MGCENTLRRMFPSCIIIRKGKPLKLPYSSRDPGTVKDVVEGSQYLLSCSGKELGVLVFVVRGLRDRLVVCSGSSIVFRLRSLYSGDELSGLTLRLRAPVVCIDDCCLDFRWKKSMFILEPQEVLGCSKCRYV